MGVPSPGSAAAAAAVRCVGGTSKKYAAKFLAPQQHPPQRGGELADYFTMRVIDGGKVFSIILMILFIIIIMSVVLYIIYLIKTDQYSTVTIIKGSINVAEPGNSVQKVTLPTTTNGTITYSFWTYLTSFVPQGISSEPGLVWIAYSANNGSSTAAGGAENSSNTKTINNASPIVFIDALTNRMYASFYLTNSQNAVHSTGNFKLSELIPDVNNTNGDMRKRKTKSLPYVTMIIDYVPLQRWVQFTFVINQSTISIYQDASVYSVRSASDLIPNAQANQDTTRNYRPIFNYTPPNNFAVTPDKGSRFNGPQINSGLQQQNMYLSSLQYYNYGLNQSDIQRKYGKGPQTSAGWFGWLNLGHWKLQWPVAHVPKDSATNNTPEKSSII